MMELRKIYFDLDGVLADFDKGVWDMCGFRTPRQDANVTTSQLWRNISRISHFYDRLEMCDGAEKMLNFAMNEFGDKCEILTGIPKPENGITTAAEDKIAWMRRFFGTRIIVHTVLREEKKLFCQGPEDILIDDLEKNIEEWNACHGTGIMHKNCEDTLQKLKELAGAGK